MHTIRIFFVLTSLLLTGFLFAEDLNQQLIEATRNGDVATVKSLLDRGADVNAKSRYNITPLAISCDKGNLEMVKLLVERGADLNAEDSFYHASPLSWAAENGNVEIMKFLI
ncbi:MAG TPA: ankyrin repeat domain-containing protein, partial [Acidobacteriota bacterium]|nr:ankyrin repeat domain-containing protein [Acidobacteriota bacterium]